jgi:SAM-dependent methyltransferase
MSSKQNQKTYTKMADSWSTRRKQGEVLGHSRIERPAMLEALPDLQGKSVLALGCGSSDECKVLGELGASKVLGLDFSPELLEIAREQTPGGKFIQGDLNHLDHLELACQFDLVFASLALHYSQDFDKTLKQIYLLTKTGGILLFSLPHPVYYGAYRRRDTESREVLMGFEMKEEQITIYGDYLKTRAVSESLGGVFPVSFNLRSIANAVTAVLGAGFTLEALIEPSSTTSLPEDNLKTQKFIERHQRIPFCFIIRARK